LRDNMVWKIIDVIKNNIENADIKTKTFRDRILNGLSHNEWHNLFGIPREIHIVKFKDDKGNKFFIKSPELPDTIFLRRGILKVNGKKYPFSFDIYKIISDEVYRQTKIKWKKIDTIRNKKLRELDNILEG